MKASAQLRTSATTVVDAILNPLWNQLQAGGRPILVVGMPRSGTTWLGKTLGYAPEALYYHESGAPATEREFCEKTWAFYAVPGRDYDWIREKWDPIFRGKLVHGAMWHNKIPRRLRPGFRVVDKEVVPFFLTEWLAEHYNCEVLFIVRHPCGVAASYNALDWRGSMMLWKDENTVKYHLAPYVDRMQEARTHWELVGVEWGARHKVMTDWLVEHPRWRCIRYEDLCRDPLKQFRELYEAFGLTWTNVAATRIETDTSSENPSKQKNLMNTQRVSSLVFDRWRQKMSKDEIEQVRCFAEYFDLPWYRAETDW